MLVEHIALYVQYNTELGKEMKVMLFWSKVMRIKLWLAHPTAVNCSMLSHTNGSRLLQVLCAIQI